MDCEFAHQRAPLFPKGVLAGSTGPGHYGEMRPSGHHLSSSLPDQRTFDFNPIEATPKESERLRRIALQWTLEEAEEDFKQLPGETLSEFMEARRQHLRNLETFGPLFPREPSEAWQLVQGLRRAVSPRNSHCHLTIPKNEKSRNATRCYSRSDLEGAHSGLSRLSLLSPGAHRRSGQAGFTALLGILRHRDRERQHVSPTCARQQVCALCDVRGFHRKLFVQK